MTANLTPQRDRAVSVTRTDGPLTANALETMLVGREVYRHTRYLVVRGQDGAALVEVERQETEPLFSPITATRLLDGPEGCVWVESPETDTSVPSQLAAAAELLAPDATTVVVSGRYGHVGFIAEPTPLELHVLDVVPPFPPKLADQVRRVLDTAEDLPPVVLREELVDLRELATTLPSPTYLLPCRAGQTSVEGSEVVFLDERPPREEWVLVGCARSRELHRWFYGDRPPSVDSCPRERIRPGVRTLTKCCLLDQGMEWSGSALTVPWGASLDEVRTALEQLVAGEVAPS